MSQFLTQFNQTPEKGQIAYGTTPNTISGTIRASGSLVVGPAVAVKLYNVAGAVAPVFDKAAAGDAIFGFVRYQVQKNIYTPAKDVLEVCFDNSIMVMEAGAAISAGAQLEINATTNKVITNAGTNTNIGIALAPAADDGDLIPVLIKTPSLAINLSSLPAIAFTDLSDAPSSLGTGLQVLRVNAGATALEFFTNSFVALSDTPNTLGSALQVLRTNAGVTALEFFTNSFLLLSDTPSTFADSGSYTVKVNSGATALEFVNVV